MTAGIRQEEVRVLLIILHQPILIFAQPQEICLFLGVHHIAAAVGAFAVFQLRGGEERFARHAVFAAVFALVNIALIVQLFENCLHRRLMVSVGGADKAVVGHIQAIPYLFDLGRDLIHILFGADALFFGDLFDLLSVFIRSGQKIYIKPHHAFVPRDHIGQHHIVGVANVRLAGCIRNGGGQIKLFFFHAESSSLIVIYILYCNRFGQNCNRFLQEAGFGVDKAAKHGILIYINIRERCGALAPLLFFGKREREREEDL